MWNRARPLRLLEDVKEAERVAAECVDHGVQVDLHVADEEGDQLARRTALDLALSEMRSASKGISSAERRPVLKVMVTAPVHSVTSQRIRPNWLTAPGPCWRWLTNGVGG